MSVLLPATRAVLSGVRPREAFFPNAMAAESFAALHSRGDLTVLPHVSGGYVVFDRRAANGLGVLAGPGLTLPAADRDLARLAAERSDG